MITFFIQTADWLANGTPHLFVLFFVWVWAIWLTRAAPALFYRPYTTAYTTTATVIVPVVDEPPELFREVLGRIVAQRPHELIVVINGVRNPTLEAVCAEFAPAVEVFWTPQAGKRNALRIGIERASGAVCVLVDSDTFWTKHTLAELLKPFADRRVGGVTSNQRVIRPERNWLTRFASWMEDIRTNSSMPAQSVFGQIGCLPGRTIAFRSAILRRAMPDFLTERFLGIHQEISDDRSLTNYTLRYGYRTVYQSSCVVYTDAPTRLGIFVRQQLRWSRGSQYNTMHMWWWMALHTPLLWLHFTADILTPFLLVGVFANMLWRVLGGVVSLPFIEGTALDVLWVQILLSLFGSCLSIGVRQISHFRRAPFDILLLPLFVVVMTLLMVPIRIWGFMTAGYPSGWGTRKNAYQSPS